MTNTIKLPDHVETVISSTTFEDLERLVKGIDHRQITDFVKHSKYLQQHVFSGFRPTNLPWDRVPTKLARDAQNQPGTIRTLLRIWLISNSELCERVRNEIGTETIEDDAAKLLSSLDHNGKDRLLWALVLDEREEIQVALTNGLRHAFFSETSKLLESANRYQLTVQLEKAVQEIKDLKDKLNKYEGRDRLLNRKVGQFDELQNELQTLKDTQRDDEVRHQDELRQLKTAFQKTNDERNIAEQKINELQSALEQERSHTRELQRRIDGLEASLNATIDRQDESANNVQHRLNETLQLLEDQRKENTLLQQKLNKAEKEKAIAYDKRDEEFAIRQQAEAEVEKLERDKNVLIQQRREDSKQLESLKNDLYQAHRELAEKKAEEQQGRLTLSELDESWNTTIVALSKHLVLSLPEQEQAHQPIEYYEKWASWQRWQQLEVKWMRSLLALSASVSVEDLANAERAQKLLALRWYLLECLKLSLTETLDANNRVFNMIEQ